MALFTSIASAIGMSAATASTIGAAASLAGTAASVAGGVIQQQGQRKAIEAQKRQEAVRENQMMEESRRTTREAIRRAQIQRATSLATTTAQGASAEGSTAMAGVDATISGQMGRTIGDNQVNLGFGKEIFRENRNVLKAQQQAAMGGTIATAGSGLQSLGNSFTNNAERIGRIGGKN